MTVSSTQTRVSYSGNGTTTAFAVPFYFLANGDLLVILRSSAGAETTQILNVDYTVSGSGVSTGGTVTMTAAPASGTTLVITRNVSATQTTDLLPNDRLPAESIERALDKLTMLIQQDDEVSDRSIKFPTSDSASLISQLPSSSARAGKYLGFDSLGNVSVSTSAPTPFNSEDVSYVAAGSGAVIRNVRDRLRDRVSIKDFGAVGDGVTDDMSALIAAVAAAKAAGGGTVYIPNTPNGYYLRRNAGCDVSGSDGISIISDGATLKLQGGTFAETGSGIGVFYTATVGCSNFTVSGLRFVSASQVTRYLNGGASGATHFDPEAAAGRANINETTSFRYCFNIQGDSSNITIDNCYFGPGIYEGVKISSGVSPVTTTGIQLSNLVFDGVNEQCVLVSYIKNAVISNISSLNHQGCKFDWTFYFSSGMENISVSNVTIKNEVSTPGVGCSAIVVGDGADGFSFSSVSLENIPRDAIVIGTSYGAVTKNITFSSLNIVNSGTVLIPAVIIYPSENVAFSGVTIEDCPWPFGIIGGKNVNISNFVINNATKSFADGSDYDCSWQISDGTIVDGGGLTVSGSAYPVVILAPNPSYVRTLKFSNVDFVFSATTPTLRQVDVRGNGDIIELVNCRFRSELATCSAIPLLASFTTGTGKIIVDRCSTSGYSVAMTYSGANGLNTIPFVAELPQAEVTLTANSATPSVSGNQLFVTANTLATSITNFTNGVQGQQIYVRVNDANTTFDFTGSSLKGNGGVDFTAASGDLLMATKLGSNWYCTIVEA